MSYTSQKIVKHGEDQFSMDIELNPDNLREIDNLEKAFMMEKSPSISLSSQTTLKSYKMHEI